MPLNKKDELDEINRVLDSLDLTDFERETLLPMIIDRMRFYLSQFKALLPICENPENALFVDAVVRRVVANPAIDPNVPTPKAGEEYLRALKSSITEYWITELEAFIKLYPEPSCILSGKDLFRITQKAQSLAGSIVWCKSRLLSYSLRCFPLIINKATGRSESGPPEEIEIIVFPIKGILSEMESSASSLMETLQLWSRSKRESRKEFIGYLSALEQTRSAKILTSFQIWVIVFTVIFTLASGRVLALLKSILHFLLPCLF